ncbi:MAG: CvpA family protein [Bacilli bacterium]
MKNKIMIVRLAITLLLTCLIYYFTLPVINLSDGRFYNFIVIILLIFIMTSVINVVDIKNLKFTTFKKTKGTLITIVSVALVFGLIFIINLVYSPLFNSKMYYERIKITKDKTFTETIKPVDFNAIPLLDKASSEKLGDRVMGQMPELVSQFTVSSLYTQINYNNDIVRVTPLEYADIIKYFTNMKEGVKGYITVNSVTGESKLTKLKTGMKYMPSALFSKDLARHLRFKYPTTIFDRYSFEIDEKGNPFWIVPTIKYKGVGVKKEINGVITVDPVTGKTKKYEIGNVPSWIDHVYTADLILEQVDDWGKYENGYLNSVFGQKGVVRATKGYNYTTIGDDVYLYTGITSATSDESNLGFILTNMRTKETAFYKVPGAEEYSAMASAEGQVQQMKYSSTFPLLINLNNRPTYLVSLKDNAGLVKMYGFIDVADYQKVSVTDASLGIEKAAQNYISNVEVENNDLDKTISLTIKEITSAQLSSNTVYYILDELNNKYKVKITTNENLLPFLKVGNKVKITYKVRQDINEINTIEKE